MSAENPGSLNEFAEGHPDTPINELTAMYTERLEDYKATVAPKFDVPREALPTVEKIISNQNTMTGERVA